MPRTIGLMSGTSLDGVDAAWLDTDGERLRAFGPALSIPYDDALRRDLRRDHRRFTNRKAVLAGNFAINLAVDSRRPVDGSAAPGGGCSACGNRRD